MSKDNSGYNTPEVKKARSEITKEFWRRWREERGMDPDTPISKTKGYGKRGNPDKERPYAKSDQGRMVTEDEIDPDKLAFLKRLRFIYGVDEETRALLEEHNLKHDHDDYNNKEVDSED